MYNYCCLLPSVESIFWCRFKFLARLDLTHTERRYGLCPSPKAIPWYSSLPRNNFLIYLLQGLCFEDFNLSGNFKPSDWWRPAKNAEVQLTKRCGERWFQKATTIEFEQPSSVDESRTRRISPFSQRDRRGSSLALHHSDYFPNTPVCRRHEWPLGRLRSGLRPETL